MATSVTPCSTNAKWWWRSLIFCRKAQPNLRCRPTAVFASALLCLVHAAHGMDPERAMSQYVRDRWGTEQGFPKGPVYAITQTADGYLWIGTEAGLVRFDGWNFRLINDQSGAFTIASVLGLVADKDGGLYIRLPDFTLVRYRNGSFERPSPNVEAYSQIDAMSSSMLGDVLVSKMEAGA